VAFSVRTVAHEPVEEVRVHRRLLAGLVGALALLTTAGCTSAADRPSGTETTSAAPTPSPSATPSRTGAPVTLRFAVYGGRESLVAYRALAKAYTAEHPNVTVEVDASSSASAAESRLNSRFTAGTSPDVFLTDASRLPRLMAEGRVQPVDELLEKRGVQFGDHYERLGLEAFSASSALQCMPDDVSPLVVFYNKALVDLSVLRPEGLPPLKPEATGWTWQDFVNAATQAAAGGVDGAYLPPRLQTLTPLLRSGGTDIVDDAQKPTTMTLADDKARPLLQQVIDLTHNPQVSPTRAELARTGVVRMFRQGRLAMMVGTRALVPQLRRTSLLDFDVYPLPSLGHSETVADVRGYCLAADSAHRDAAADFLAFASSDRGAALTAASGAVVPANLDVRSSEAFAQRDKFPVSSGVFARTLRRASLMPAAPAWPDVVRRTQPLVTRLFTWSDPRLNRLLPRIDSVSARLLAQPSASPSPGG
jgi:multiple sugar transport system substrate-binding protein